MIHENPCLTCGACCAYPRVSFYWAEADPAVAQSVPLELTEPLPPHRLCMKGTNQLNPRCIALEGQVGSLVRCTIYSCRPSPCREFGVGWEARQLVYIPEELQRCSRARAARNLPPLEVD